MVISIDSRFLDHRVSTAAELSRHIAVRGAAGRGVLPVPSSLAPALPSESLERGRIYGCAGDASLSLLFALVSVATREGSWFAMVDMDHAGLQSAREHGVALQRTVCASSGGEGAWPLVVGSLVDGFDVVAVTSPPGRPQEARRIAARVRSSGAVLLVLGDKGGFEVDAVLRARTVSWRFDLHAQVRTVEVSSSGRRAHRGGRCVVHLPVPPEPDGVPAGSPRWSLHR